VGLGCEVSIPPDAPHAPEVDTFLDRIAETLETAGDRLWHPLVLGMLAVDVSVLHALA
jgi:hypothetical protein